MQKTTADLNIKIESPLTLGMYHDKNGFRFATSLPKNNTCGIYLWKIEDIKRQNYKISLHEAVQISFTDTIRTGNVYAGSVDKFTVNEYAYCFYTDDILLSDDYGRGFLKPVICEVEHKKESVSILLAYIPETKFNWGKDIKPNISFSDSIIYGLHVKGYTKHDSSGVKNKGTFKGISEKIPYMKQLGITAVECMPVNEFITTEVPDEKDRIALYSYQEKIPNQKKNPTKLNYWGFKQGYYFSPKLSYSSSENVQVEFKSMVKKLHQNNLEIILQFYFPKGYSASIILDVLKFWVLEYHVDGFRLIGDGVPKEIIANEGIFSDTKIIFDQYHDLYENKYKSNEHLAMVDTSFTIQIRKYLKGDEDTVQEFVNHMYQRGKEINFINCVSDYQGFTLFDLVSYDRKHNEKNEENNKDGTDYNYSWNCGEEGVTKKRKVISLRKRQMKNALLMLFLAQGTPYIKAGDEFAFSQQGNNNPYCQDNEITWINWNDYKKNRKQVHFVKNLISIRKSHPILHLNKDLRVMDYLGCGYPDVSFHGEEAWRPILDHVSRQVGILYCGKYAKINKKEDQFIYIVYNMHWDEHEFAKPRLPKNKSWSKIIDTFDPNQTKKIENSNKLEKEKIKVSARSIQIYISEDI